MRGGDGRTLPQLCCTAKDRSSQILQLPAGMGGLGLDAQGDRRPISAIAQIVAEKSNPVGDIGYFGVTFGILSWFPAEGLGSVVTHQVQIGDFDGPHPFFGPDGKLL
jgi:hypothetical protein